MEGDSPRRPPLCPGSQITSAHVSARGRNPDRVRDLVPSGGYSPPGAQSRRTTTGRSFSQAPGPSPAPPPPRQGSPGVARRLGPSAFSPPQAASPGKAAASALRSGPRPRAPPIGRFRSPALSRIAVGAHPRSAPSANTASLPGPRSVRRRRGSKGSLAGPSGAKQSGVRHLRVLGHAPITQSLFYCFVMNVMLVLCLS
ncbi:hypothetical protein NDU88_001785 [Pleurodeles waltl]|uniref:Uncharacterized protein n=1 Tax=Pleurodeles waltl TaxID=8319 RepID=A0AAV7KQC8_PLEWA|nr:hypothetical protein NDU88_001785 [Pleurodeles waltl]